MKVMITGGAGFIGSELVRQLIGLGAEVLNVDKLTYAGNLSSLVTVEKSLRYHFIKMDICQTGQMLDYMKSFKPQWIFHLAAESHVDRSITTPKGFIETNVVGTGNLLAAGLAYFESLTGQEQDEFRFVHISTDEVFGSLNRGQSAFTEQTTYAPNSPYAASKAASDHFVRAWFKTYGFPVMITHCSNNYGPYQFPEKLIPLMILNAERRQPLPLYGDGLQIRDWLYVSDHVEALRLIAEWGIPGETYLIGGEEEKRNLDVVQLICKFMDEKIPTGAPHDRFIISVADRPGHDFRYAVNSQKLRSHFGWRPRLSFIEGLELTVDWYLTNRWWWQKVQGGINNLDRTK